MELPNSYEERGKEIGIVEGRKEGTLETAKNLLLESVPIDLIERVTGLDREEIEKLKQE